MLADSLPSEPPGKPFSTLCVSKCFKCKSDHSASWIFKIFPDFLLTVKFPTLQRDMQSFPLWGSVPLPESFFIIISFCTAEILLHPSLSIYLPSPPRPLPLSLCRSEKQYHLLKDVLHSPSTSQSISQPASEALCIHLAVTYQTASSTTEPFKNHERNLQQMDGPRDYHAKWSNRKT